VTDTTTVVTGLGGDVVTASRRGTLLGDVTGLTTGVTLGDTGLTVTGKVVWTATLVTSGLVVAVVAAVAAVVVVVVVVVVSGTEGLLWSCIVSLWLGTVSGNVTELTTVVTTGALALLGTVSLDMTDTTTVVALLLSVLSWFWTVSGLVARLTTVVTQTLLLGAHLGNVTNLTALVTGSWENSSHFQ
jgi:hypothetical protein